MMSSVASCLYDSRSCLKGIISCSFSQTRIPNWLSHAFDVSTRCHWLHWHTAIPDHWMNVQHWVQHLNSIKLAIRLPQPSLTPLRCSFPVRPVCLLILNVRTDTWILGQTLLNISLHAFASSSRVFVCSVEPGSADDVSKIVRSCPSFDVLHLIACLCSFASYDPIAHLLR